MSTFQEPICPVAHLQKLGRNGPWAFGVSLSLKCPFSKVLICKNLGEMNTGHLGYLFSALGVPLSPKRPFAPSPHLLQCPFAPIPIFYGAHFHQMPICPKCLFTPNSPYPPSAHLHRWAVPRYFFSTGTVGTL